MTLTAAPVFWTFQNGTFADGGTLTGSFDFDAVTGMASNWNLTYTPVPSPPPPFAFTPANSNFTAGQCCTDQFEFLFTTFDGALTLTFAFNPDLTNAGGTSTIAPGGGLLFILSDLTQRSTPLVSGSVVSRAVPGAIPEPVTLALTGAGLLVFLWARRSLSVGWRSRQGTR